METPQLHHHGHMPRITEKIVVAVTPTFAGANRPSLEEIAVATSGDSSVWRLYWLLFRDRLPRRAILPE